MAARLAQDAEQAAHWLDRAVARAPRSTTTARWLRIARRLELGRLEDALADVEHLEAMARGGRAKHAVWLRAGQAWQAAGLGTRAGAVFERALRHAPDDPRALAGLGVALVSEGREARGVTVLERALEQALQRGEADHAIRLALGRALAEHLDDLPSGIAHVAAIPADVRETAVARGLEGRWRAHLGDVAGAALAFARLRELAAAIAPGHGEDLKGSPVQGDVIAGFLREAAVLERERLHSLLGAQRHLAVALRLRPHDPELRRAYREIGELIVHPTVEPTHAPPESQNEVVPEVAQAASEPERAPALGFSLAADSGADEEDAVAAARVEDLTRLLQANPRDDQVADELASLLESLGRGHELLALLLGRFEDAPPRATRRTRPESSAPPSTASPHKPRRRQGEHRRSLALPRRGGVLSIASGTGSPPGFRRVKPALPSRRPRRHPHRSLRGRRSSRFSSGPRARQR